jgi:multicomponent K+:H+ antiporter subunit A
MSLVALGGGAVLYALLQKYLARGEERAPILPHLDSRQLFDRALVAATRRWPRALEAWLGTQRLQTQLRWLVLAALVAGVLPVWNRGLEWGPLAGTALDPALALVWTVGAVCALGAAWQAKFHRLVALLLAGGAGLVVCMTFVRMSAPDLALTQLLVEIVTTVLLLLGLRWLPKRVPYAWTRAGALAALPRRLRDLALALASGGGAAALAYAVMTRPLPDTISSYFMENAWPQGGGTNVVNIIIVDFRAFDTLGEISVLAVVGVAVYALLRRFRPARESLDTPARPDAGEDMLVPAVIMRLMFPVIGVLAG